MATDTVLPAEHSRVGQLAKQLELDIRRRGLRQGESYLTADGAGTISAYYNYSAEGNWNCCCRTTTNDNQIQ
jgi:hypothetical protein